MYDVLLTFLKSIEKKSKKKKHGELWQIHLESKIYQKTSKQLAFTDRTCHLTVV